MTDQELHDAQLRDLSNYSEAFAEERFLALAQGIEQGIEQGIGRGKAEGFVEGMKAMARKMFQLNRPLQEIIKDTGLTKAEVLKLTCS